MRLQSMIEFKKFSSIPRLSKDMIITEKLDGTNAQIFIAKEDEIEFNERDKSPFYKTGVDDLYIAAGSRNRWLNLDADNYGFCSWVVNNAQELVKIGHGRYYGEWWGQGIQHGYNLKEKRFWLFNPDQGNYLDLPRHIGVDVVPTLYKGPFCTKTIERVMENLKESGSIAAPGYMNPEGIIIYHTGSGQTFKKTFNFDKGKWNQDV